MRQWIAQPGGVLPPQGDDGQPHIAGMVRHLVRDLGQRQRIVRAGEQSVRPGALGTGTAGDVADVVFLFRQRVVVVLQRTGDELRGVAAGGRGQIVLVLEQSPAQREVSDELLHHLPLFFRGGQSRRVRGDALRTLAGGHVADVVSQVCGLRRAALEIGALEDDARHEASPPSVRAALIRHRVLQRDAAVGLFHILDAPAPQFPQLILRNFHARGQDVHHHVHLHRQLEQDAADMCLAALHGGTDGGHQHGRQYGEAILGGQVVAVEP